MAVLAVLLVIYLVPFLVYGGASVISGLQPPTTASPARFLLGVLVTKLGTAIAFVVIFDVSRAVWGPRWPLYAFLWFVMFALSEAGETVSGRTTSTEAALGIVSEAIYAPIAAFMTQWILGRGAA
jgi:hypothetical protein